MDRLKELRTERGYTQAYVAEQLNMSKTGYNRLEKGSQKLTQPDLVKIADFYDVSVDYLIGRTDNRDVHRDPDEMQQMAFGATLADGMSYDDLSPTGKAQLYEYYQFLRQRYPKKE